MLNNGPCDESIEALPTAKETAMVMGKLLSWILRADMDALQTSPASLLASIEVAEDLVADRGSEEEGGDDAAARESLISRTEAESIETSSKSWRE